MNICDGGTYRPGPLHETEVRALRQMEGHSLPHPEQPDWVRLNVQEWVAPHLQEAYGAAWGREIAAIENPPPVDLRVNRLKATVAEARAALADEGIDTEPMRFSPDGLRLKRRLSVVSGKAIPGGSRRDPRTRARNLVAAPRRRTSRHADRRLLRWRRRPRRYSRSPRA